VRHLKRRGGSSGHQQKPSQDRWSLGSPRAAAGGTTDDRERQRREARRCRWSWSRGALAHFIETALAQTEVSIPFQARDAVWRILERLSRDIVGRNPGNCRLIVEIEREVLSLFGAEFNVETLGGIKAWNFDEVIRYLTDFEKISREPLPDDSENISRR
jgi:hypothetical protein